jgi:hypothetical protein
MMIKKKKKKKKNVRELLSNASVAIADVVSETPR